MLSNIASQIKKIDLLKGSLCFLENKEEGIPSGVLRNITDLEFNDKHSMPVNKHIWSKIFFRNSIKYAILLTTYAIHECQKETACS